MLEAHPDIVQASVVPVPDEIKGEKPFAFVVARAGHALTEDDVKQYALAKAPAYQHPRRVVFVDALPMAGTSKIDRAALRRRALEQLERGGDRAMKAAVIREHGGPGSIAIERDFPDPKPGAERRRRPRARDHAELPRHLHAPRHAGHQGADAVHHGHRLRRRHRRGRQRRHGLEGRRARDDRSGRSRRTGRADRRDVARRPRGVLPRARRIIWSRCPPTSRTRPRRACPSPTAPRCA